MYWPTPANKRTLTGLRKLNKIFSFLVTKVSFKFQCYEGKFLGMKVSGNESSTYGTFVLRNKSSWVRKFQLPLDLYQITICCYQCYRASHVSTHTSSICLNFIRIKYTCHKTGSPSVHVHKFCHRTRSAFVYVRKTSCGSGSADWRVCSSHISANQCKFIHIVDRWKQLPLTNTVLCSNYHSLSVINLSLVNF